MFTPMSAYRALTTGVGFFDRSGRVRIDVSGPDRVRFLHNLTTNDVKRLAVNQGQEAFVTSLQGKTLGSVLLLACDDRILLRADDAADTLAVLLPHLQKYGIFDDIALDDIGARTFEYHLAGPGSEELLSRLGGTVPGPKDLAHHTTRIGDASVRVVREAPTGRPGLTLIGDAKDAALVSDRLHAEGTSLGLVDGDAATFEAARIEAGTPRFGHEVSVDTLPQELGRDARAISFVKGCYLGQETVARIDALGHVNKHLKGLKFRPGPGPVPTAGATIEADGKGVGKITSAANSPGWGHPVALALLRTAQANAGNEVHVRSGDATLTAVVADLPMLPPCDDPATS
jgi:tRNA-modifying protein YgfZ